MRGVSMARGTKPNWMIDIAQERMDILFNRAEKEYKEHPERSHRYVELARKISKINYYFYTIFIILYNNIENLFI